MGPRARQRSGPATETPRRFGMRKLKPAAVIAALTAAISMFFACSAQAALLSDLTALGYTVSAATQCENAAHAWVNVWYVSGFGMGAYLSECDPDFQATVDSIANPAAHCNRKWSYTHPDQVDAWSAIAQLGWTTSADKCGDVFTVTNPNDQTARYSGPGSGLAELAAAIGAPPVPPPVVEPPAPPVPTPPAPTPAPAAIAAPQTAPAVQVAATPEPAPTAANDTVTTAPTVTITLTAAQLKAIIDQAVSKAVGKAMAKATSGERRAVAASSRPKAPAHARARKQPSRRASKAAAHRPLSRLARSRPRRSR